MERICVFLGSDIGIKAEYQESTKQLAKILVNRNIELVYGAAKVGLMGILADEVLSLGGKVIGVIPEGLKQKEVVHEGLTELIVVSSMHERKAKMAGLSSGFITLPGGIGTLEETCEILTWAQIGIHKKPCGLLNVAGYYDHLIAFIDNMVANQFFRDIHRSLLIVENDPEALLNRFEEYQPADFKRWMKEDES